MHRPGYRNALQDGKKQGACMEYAVLVERKTGGWRAFIPALADLDAEGVSRDEAVQNVQRAAEAYLASVEVTTIKVKLPQEPSRRPGSPRTLLRALAAFAGDEEALREHFEDIARERQRQRAAAQQQDAE
jgi:predicted RNase H-like HicB family nuclease